MKKKRPQKQQQSYPYQQNSMNAPTNYSAANKRKNVILIVASLGIALLIGIILGLVFAKPNLNNPAPQPVVSATPTPTTDIDSDEVNDAEEGIPPTLPDTPTPTTDTDSDEVNDAEEDTPPALPDTPEQTPDEDETDEAVPSINPNTDADRNEPTQPTPHTTTPPETSNEGAITGTYADHTTWSYQNGVFTYYCPVSNDYTNRDNPGKHVPYDEVKTVVVKEGTLSVNSAVFHRFKNLEEIYIPESVRIMDAAFSENVTGLKVYYPGSNLDWDYIAMDYRANNCKFIDKLNPTYYFGKPSVDLETNGKCGENAFWHLDSSGTLTITGTGRIAGPYDYGRIHIWRLPAKKVKKIVIENGITLICGDTFGRFGHYCDNLETVILADSVKEIGTYAFGQLNAHYPLKTVHLPKNLTKIHEGAFSNCTKLTTVTYNNTKANWDKVEIAPGNECLTNVFNP